MHEGFNKDLPTRRTQRRGGQPVAGKTRTHQFRKWGGGNGGVSRHGLKHFRNEGGKGKIARQTTKVKQKQTRLQKKKKGKRPK